MQMKMLEFPYVVEYKLFEQVDISVAEEILSDYNDFYGYNKMQVTQIVAPASDDGSLDDENKTEAELSAEKIEHNKKVASEHFEKLFGNKDFHNACLIGLRIDYDALQRIIMSEHRKEIPITESSFNVIVPRLRVLASILLFAEAIVSGLEKLTNDDKHKEKAELALGFAKDGFMLMLERHAEQEIAVIEFHRHKKEISKIKTVDGYINFCEKLFFAPSENE